MTNSSSFKIGQKVIVVQKTKQRRGTILKLNLKKAKVEMEWDNNGKLRKVNVPYSMIKPANAEAVAKKVAAKKQKGHKIYIQVALSQKEDAKKLKAKWDPYKKCWFTWSNNPNNETLFARYKKKTISDKKPVVAKKPVAAKKVVSKKVAANKPVAAANKQS